MYNLFVISCRGTAALRSHLYYFVNYTPFSWLTAPKPTAGVSQHHSSNHHKSQTFPQYHHLHPHIHHYNTKTSRDSATTHTRSISTTTTSPHNTCSSIQCHFINRKLQGSSHQQNFSDALGTPSLHEGLALVRRRLDRGSG